MTTRSETPQYPPQTNSGLYGAADSETTAGLSDSPKIKESLYPTTETQARPMSPTQHHRPSEWWMNLIENRYFARFTYVACLILVLIIWGVVNVTFTMQEHIYETQYSTADLKEKADALQKVQIIFKNDDVQFVFMKGRLRGFDPQKSLLSVEWKGLLVDLAQNDLHLGSTPAVRYNLAIFRDVSTERDLEAETLIAARMPNSTEAGLPQFRVFQPAPPPIGFIGRSPKDTLSTDIGVGQLDSGSFWSQPNFLYPYDRSQGTINFAMSSNDTVRLFKTSPGTFLVPIMGAVITDSILNYHIVISNTAVCEEPLGCQLDITLELQRPGLVKAVVVLTILINWAITFSIYVLTGEAIILKRMDILSGSDMLSICLTSLFALPSVRSILPGAPPFGCLLDMVGILPNIILISLCTATFAISRVKNRIKMPA